MPIEPMPELPRTRKVAISLWPNENFPYDRWETIETYSDIEMAPGALGTLPNNTYANYDNALQGLVNGLELLKPLGWDFKVTEVGEWRREHLPEED